MTPPATAARPETALKKSARAREKDRCGCGESFRV
jgi:hypothetical protein